MKRFTTSNALARERKERYAELRRSGVSATDAAAELGIDWTTRQRYEGWFRTAEGLPAEPPRKQIYAR